MRPGEGQGRDNTAHCTPDSANMTCLEGVEAQAVAVVLRRRRKHWHGVRRGAGGAAPAAAAAAAAGGDRRADAAALPPPHLPQQLEACGGCRKQVTGSGPEVCRLSLQCAARAATPSSAAAAGLGFGGTTAGNLCHWDWRRCIHRPAAPATQLSTGAARSTLHCPTQQQ